MSILHSPLSGSFNSKKKIISRLGAASGSGTTTRKGNTAHTIETVSSGAGRGKSFGSVYSKPNSAKRNSRTAAPSAELTVAPVSEQAVTIPLRDTLAPNRRSIHTIGVRSEDHPLKRSIASSGLIIASHYPQFLTAVAYIAGLVDASTQEADEAAISHQRHLPPSLELHVTSDVPGKSYNARSVKPKPRVGSQSSSRKHS